MVFIDTRPGRLVPTSGTSNLSRTSFILCTTHSLLVVQYTSSLFILRLPPPPFVVNGSTTTHTGAQVNSALQATKSSSSIQNSLDVILHLLQLFVVNGSTITHTEAQVNSTLQATQEHKSTA